MTLEFLTMSRSAELLQSLGQDVTGRAFPELEFENTLKRSSKARQVVDAVKRNRVKRVRIACFSYRTHGEYENQVCFLPAGEGEERQTNGAVFIDVDARLCSKLGDIPMGIAIIHELGHALQWMRLGYKKFLSMQELKHKFSMTSAATGNTEVSYAHDLEWENIREVEWKVCEECGVQQRQKYWDWMPPGCTGGPLNA